MEDVPLAGEPACYCFAGFVFDPVTGELDGPSGGTRLPPKAARLLALLLARPGELVSRQTLRHELWPEQHVELDQVLAYTVRQVRAALGDDGAEPRFVETLPRRGYRFVGELETPMGGAAATSSPGGGVRPRWHLALVTAAIASLAIAVLAVQRRGHVDATGGATGKPLRVALLPLGEPGLEAVNDPLTDALVVALTAQPGVELVGPATTARWRGTTRPHPELGRELGVAFVVSGGYRPTERLLFLQLVRVADGKHVFAQRYRGTREGVERQLAAAAAALAAAARNPSAGRGGQSAT